MKVPIPYGLICIFISLTIFYYFKEKRRLRNEERRDRLEERRERFMEMLPENKKTEGDEKQKD